MHFFAATIYQIGGMKVANGEAMEASHPSRCRPEAPRLSLQQKQSPCFFGL
jgi:hypothetical protein